MGENFFKDFYYEGLVKQERCMAIGNDDPIYSYIRVMQKIPIHNLEMDEDLKCNDYCMSYYGSEHSMGLTLVKDTPYF